MYIQIQVTPLWECTTECEAGWSLPFRGQDEHGGHGRRVDVVRGQEVASRAELNCIYQRF